MLILTVPVFSQIPSQKEQLRILVWADLDAYPGHFEDEDKAKEDELHQRALTEKDEFSQFFGFAIDRTKEIAPFLLSGMLDGWTFEYTPYDKTRKVAEFWEMGQVNPFNPEKNQIVYHDPEVKEDRLLCWIFCERNYQQRMNYEYWDSIVHPRIHGNGSGKVEDGFEGIKEACSNALKQAVRDYWRTQKKNKPKEISGKVLLIREPRVYIKEGQYIVDLDFFIQTDRIIMYSYY